VTWQQGLRYHWPFQAQDEGSGGSDTSATGNFHLQFQLSSLHDNNNKENNATSTKFFLVVKASLIVITF
jgi:hypothetical protein